MQKGINTSEFWLVVIGAAITIANDGLGLGLDRETIMTFAAMIASYAGGRSYVKAKQAAQ